MAIGGLAAILWALTSRFTWDEQDLRWRSWGRWTRVPWSEVRDFYLEPPRRANVGIRMVIDTAVGTRALTGDDWVGREALRDAVCRYAMATPARSWAIKGTRPGDAPRRFDYPLSTGYSAIAQLLLFGGGGIVIAAMLLSRTAALSHTFGWSGTIILLLVTMTMPVGMAFAGVILAKRELYVFTHRDETVTVSSDGIRFQGSASTIEAHWDEIVSCRWADPAQSDIRKWGCTIETRHGWFRIASGLRDYYALIAILREKIPGAFQYIHDDVLGVAPAKYGVVAHESVYPRVYHFRTRSNRAMLLLPILIGVMPFALIPLQRMADLPPLEKSAWPIIFVGEILVAWLVWCYFRAAIVIDDEGITQIAPFVHRHLAWSDITICRDNKNDQSLCLTGVQTRITVPSLIGGFKELRAEIEKRTGQR